MRLAVVSLIIAVGGCVGTLEEKFPASNGGGPDGGASAAECDPVESAVASGEHNPGLPCMACHAPGGEGPTFSLGGTLYDGIAGTAVAGATIHVLDADGNDITMLSAANGNFWTTQAVAFPVTTHASACPTTIPMVSAVTETGADCNSAGCHADGFRIHVP
jgi:hypothetical protein